MTQAGFFDFAIAQGAAPAQHLQAASLVLLRHATRQWTRLVECQMAFSRDSLDAVLEELARAGTDDPRRALLDWPIASGRRLLALWLRHLQQTSELIVEGQCDWLETVVALAKTPASPSGGAESSGQTEAADGQAATAEPAAVTEAATEAIAAAATSGGDAPAERQPGRASRREASAA
jgi:hypothetical protein